MRLQTLMPVIMTGAVLSFAGCQADAGGLSESDIQAIEAIHEQFVRHIEAGDTDSLAALYTEDAVLMPPNAPSVFGRDAIREFNAAFPPVIEFKLVNDEIEGVGDLAYVRGRYFLRLAVPGEPVDSGKYLEIRRRQADGSWKYTVDIFNSDLPVPLPQEN